MKINWKLEKERIRLTTRILTLLIMKKGVAKEKKISSRSRSLNDDRSRQKEILLCLFENGLNRINKTLD